MDSSVATLLGFAGGIAIRAQGAGQGHSSDQCYQNKNAPGCSPRQGAFPRAVRPLPQRARRQAAQDRPALERARALHGRDCPGGERVPPGQDRGRTTRSDAIHFELDEDRGFGRKGSTKTLVPRHRCIPACVALRPLVHPSECRTRTRRA